MIEIKNLRSELIGVIKDRVINKHAFNNDLSLGANPSLGAEVEEVITAEA